MNIFFSTLYGLFKSTSGTPIVTKAPPIKQHPLHVDDSYMQAARSRQTGMNEQALKARSIPPYQPTQLEYFTAAALTGLLARDDTDLVYTQAIDNAVEMIKSLYVHQAAEAQKKACQNSESAERAGRDSTPTDESIVIHPESKVTPIKES